MCKNLAISFFSAEIGNSQSRYTRTSILQSKLCFLLSISNTFPKQNFLSSFIKSGRNSQAVPPFWPGERVSVPLSVRAFSNFFLDTFQLALDKSILVDQEIKIMLNKVNKSCLTRSDSFPQLNICGSHEKIRASPSDIPKVSQ